MNLLIGWLLLAANLGSVVANVTNAAPTPLNYAMAALNLFLAGVAACLIYANRN